MWFLFLLLPAPVLSAAPAGAQTEPPLSVRVERTASTGQTPLWIGIRVFVTGAGTGNPFAPEHTVFAVARNARGDRTEPYGLKLEELDDPAAPPGRSEGFVIVPYGGPWTVTASVNKLQPDPKAPPVVLGQGALEVTVDAPATPAAAQPGPARPLPAPRSDGLSVSVLWLHTMVAIGWSAAVAVLALLALPSGRRLLSEYGGNLLDGRLDRLVRAAWWLTGLVVATGIYNLVKSVAYRVPLSPSEAERLFRLPYAEPYYLTLLVKLAAYAVMVAVSVPLIREARRQAGRTVSPAAVPADDGPSPWDRPGRSGTGSGVGIGVQTRPAGVAVPARQRNVAGLVGAFAAGGAVVVAAVTLLKYLHLLGEVARLGG